MTGTRQRVGVATDHGGFDLKVHLVEWLRAAGRMGTGRDILAARFSGAERHRRRLSKVAARESKEGS